MSEKYDGVDRSEENKPQKENSFLEKRFSANEKYREEKLKKRMGPFSKGILALAVLGMVVIGAIVALRFVLPSTEKVVEPFVIEEKMEEIQQLSTFQYTSKKDKTYSKPIKILNKTVPLTTKSFKFIYDFKVEYSFDLSKCDTMITNDKVIIILPKITAKPHISTTVLNEKNNIVNPISAKDMDEIEKYLKDYLTGRAVKKGVLDKARSSMHKIIKSNIDPLLSEEQELEIRQSKEAIMADEKYEKEAIDKAKKAEKKIKELT